MKGSLYPLLVLAALTAAQSAHAQQGGVTILRGQSSDPSSSGPASGTPDTGVRRVPNGGTTTPAPKPAVPPATAAQPIGEGTGMIPPPVPSETAQALSGSAKPLSPAEAASLAAAIKAVDESRWADARAAVANFRQTLLDRYVDWSILRVAPKTEASFADTWRFLREQPDWPEPEVLRRQAEDRIGPETPPSDVFRYFTAFPPLTSTGHMRRMEAAQAASPNDLKKFASNSWRGATFRNADENEFLNRYGHLLTGEDHVARFDRLMLEGKPQVARELVAKLPPDNQPLANARLAMATRAADAVTVLRGVAAAKLDEPAIKLERAQWMRRTGSLDDARALLAKPIANQNDAWWNERNQVARDLLAAGRAADAYAIVVPHGLTRGVS
ncbi:MAG TPA: hypothetical protein VF915_11450, partial [Reyranella sp.]